MTLQKTKKGYLLYIILDEVKINIDGWFKQKPFFKNQADYYQWIGTRN